MCGGRLAEVSLWCCFSHAAPCSLAGRTKWCRRSRNEYVTLGGSAGHFRTTAVKWSLLAEGPPSPSESHIAHEAHKKRVCLRSAAGEPAFQLLPESGWAPQSPSAHLMAEREMGRGVLTWIHSPSLVSIPDTCFPLIVYRE